MPHTDSITGGREPEVDPDHQARQRQAQRECAAFSHLTVRFA